LRALHLSEDDIDAAISEIFPEGEEESARRALDRFLRHPRTGLSREKRMAKAYRHLLTRGFSPSVAHRLVSSPDFEDTGS
jgi:SOS response regulatory protein OraA/RecX